ncbi:MAG TPA: nicotinate-nucleotide adenylyltransferase [Gemmatimonadales bacterium]|nr:nicotinate-nucleotide adenylyltransferase [Gemmatimonadales bacterium]
MVERPVGLFGGSFDPVHHGHLIVARAALERLGLAEVRFIPAREQPFKQGRHQASAADRVEMLRLATAGEPGFRVDTLELDRPGPSYTVDTLRQLTAQEPSRAFILLLGADAARDFAGWREASVIPTLAEVAVLVRPGAEESGWPDGATRVPIPAIEVSATEVRRRVAAGRPIRYWVPDAVAGHIAARGLYRTEET